MRRRITILACLLVILAGAGWATAETERVYFGTYTRGDSEGIYTALFDSETGKLSDLKLAAALKNPSFVEVHPSGKYIFAVAEVGGGSVFSFRIDPQGGELTPINSQSSGGNGPCHVSVTPDGKCVLVANYGSGVVASFPVSDDGKLSEAATIMQHEGSSVNERRQKEPHAHSINPSADGKFAYAADLGTDKVMIYKLDSSTAVMEPNKEAAIAPGSGPRHFAIHPSGKYAYVINEILLTVTAFERDAQTGALTTIQTIPTLPDGADTEGASTAEIRVHPSGKFVYGSNRGHDTIVVYKVDQDTGKLTYVEHEGIQGETPRNFCIDLTGGYLFAAGQKSGTISVFRIDQETGELDYTGEQIAVSSPVCIRFLKVGDS